MKKKFIKGTAAALAAASCMAVGAIGASSLQSISAYLNYGITVKYNGQEQQMYDANGQRVYPISYNGTTYVPIRAVGNMMGIDVAWDGANNAVLLGKTGMALDFIESFTPYAEEEHNAQYYNCSHVKNADNRPLKIGNNTYAHYIAIGNMEKCAIYYDLAGRYDSITLEMFSESDSIIDFYGDNGEHLGTVTIGANNLPSSHTIDVSGVQQFKIDMRESTHKSFHTYVIDATIE